MRAIIAILVLGFLWPSLSFAQTKGNLLRGAKTLEVALDISNTREDKCAIKREDIVSAYKFPFSHSNIVLQDNGKSPDLLLFLSIVTIDILQGRDVVGCAFHVNFTVRSYFKTGALRFNGKQWVFSSHLFEETSIHTSSVSEFRNYIRKTIEEKSKKFITAYNLDNK